MIGDSVCTGIHVSTPWSTAWRARRCRDQNWFFNSDPATRIRGVANRLAELAPLSIIHYGGVGAMVDDEAYHLWFSRRVLGTRNFSGQIKRLTKARRLPDLILISIGHNNVDWAWQSPAEEIAQPKERLHRLAESFDATFRSRLRSLIEHVVERRQRTAIVVFGLIDFGSYFRGRAEVERLQAADPSLYPHLETTYKYLVSFRPDYRENVIRLGELVNDKLRITIAEMAREFAATQNLQLRYSDALAKADLSRAELLHEIDGWHASAAGHNVLAEAAFGDLQPSLEFLGIS